jgi:hypothetical protein
MSMAGEGRLRDAGGWLVGGVCRITRAFNCDTPVSVSEGAAMPGRADTGAIAAALSVTCWSGSQGECD